MTEGFAWFVSNNEGYNNVYDYEADTVINTLVMGSSHMEGYNLMPENNTTNLLQKLLGQNVYNIGISGHAFPTCAANLKSALKKYKPRYVVIETSSVKFPDATLREVLEDRLPKISAYNKGILAKLRRNNFLRLMYAKYFQDIFKAFVIAPQKASPSVQSDDISITIGKVLNKLADSAVHAGAKLIIVYHPFVSLNKDGTLEIEGDPEALKVFSDACSAKGIYFIDMSKRFQNEYQANYTLPYGFTNTSVGHGHMNKDGHRMFADEVYKLMQRIEAES